MRHGTATKILMPDRYRLTRALKINIGKYWYLGENTIKMFFLNVPCKLTYLYYT